jgi:hypothetical protein
MKRIYKIIIGILIFAVVIFGLYIYKLHALAVEGNKIFEERCLNVNPYLIGYKNSFLSFADALKNPDKYTSEQAADFYVAYIQGIGDYVPKENAWLKIQSAFINRWDFQLIEPWYIKEAAEYQTKMYEGYRDEAQSTVDAINQKISKDDFRKIFTEARDSRNKYTDLYNGVFDKVQPINDWRKIFGSVPIPKGCTEDVLIIPDTSGALDANPPSVKDPDITG